MGLKISVVIPAHNEEQNVKKLVSMLLGNFDKYVGEIIVVDDCSSDRTGKILDSLSKKIKRIKPIHRKVNPGVGNAIRAGYNKVSAKFGYILSLDCDFLENTKDIKRMITAMLNENCDMVVGSRYMRGGRLVDYPPVKKIANRSFHFLARVFFGFNQADVSNNFKLFNISVLKAIQPYLKSSGFSINAETGLYPILLGFKIIEVPVSWIGRSEEMGKSNFKVLKAGPGYVKVLISAVKLAFKRGAYSPEGEKLHFDNLVKETGETYYGNLRPVADIRFRRKALAVSGLIHGNKKINILEIGCGTGIFSRYLTMNNPSLQIKAVDISPEAIKVAKNIALRSHYKNIKYDVGDILKLPFPKDSFDMVVGNSVLHHVPLKDVFSEIKRILKPGGYIWFCEPNTLNPQICIEKNIPFIKRIFQDSPSERSFDRWNFRAFLKRNGFSKINVDPYEFLHPLIPGFLLPFVIKPLTAMEKLPIIKEFSGTLQISAKLGGK